MRSVGVGHVSCVRGLRLFHGVGDVVDLLGLPLDLLSGLSIGRPLHGAQDDVLQVQVHRVLMHLHYLARSHRGHTEGHTEVTHNTGVELNRTVRNLKGIWNPGSPL